MYEEINEGPQFKIYEYSDSKQKKEAIILLTDKMYKLE